MQVYKVSENLYQDETVHKPYAGAETGGLTDGPDLSDGLSNGLNRKRAELEVSRPALSVWCPTRVKNGRMVRLYAAGRPLKRCAGMMGARSTSRYIPRPSLLSAGWLSWYHSDGCAGSECCCS